MDQSASHADEFVRLFSLHEKTIRRYVMSLLSDWNVVDDVIQEASIAMLRKFDQYDRTKPFANWACRFAYFEVLEYRRREGKRRCFSLATIEVMAADPLMPQMESELRVEALKDCIARLAEGDVELVKLRYATDRTVREVAEAMGVAAKSLYKRLARIRGHLMKCVEGKVAQAEARG